MDKRTLVTFIYEDLRSQILSGQRPYGCKLPSAPQLCKVYDAGIGTVKAVVRMLREDGLIRTAQRSRPTVVFHPGDENQIRNDMRNTLSQRKQILEVYRTMALLMPEIFTFCTEFFEVVELEQYENAVKWTRPAYQKAGQWRTVSGLLHEILGTAGNVLFDNLYTALERYAAVPFLDEGQPPITESSPYQKYHRPNHVLNILRRRGKHSIHQGFTDYYRAIIRTMEYSFAMLRKQFPDAADDTTRWFHWSAGYNRYPYYFQIVCDIVGKIGLGVYPQDTYLPSETALAKSYSVSADTVRKAIGHLNKVGFIRTQARKGSLVVAPDHGAHRAYTKPADVSLYLSCLQLMALIIRPAALLVFDHIDERAKSKLKKDISKPGTVPLSELVDCIINYIPLYPFEVILRETNRMLHFGFYFSFFSYGAAEKDYVFQAGLKAFACLENNDREGFSENLSECYCYILTHMRTFLIESGFEAAKFFVTPTYFQ